MARSLRIMYMSQDRFYSTFGKRIRLLREDLGLTQQDVRERAINKYGVNIGQSYLSELERSDRIPGGEIVAVLASVLETTADYLLMRTDDPGVSRSADDSFFSPEAERIANMIDEIKSERRRAEAQHLVETLLAEDQRANTAEALQGDLQDFDRILALAQKRMSAADFQKFVSDLRGELGLSERGHERGA